MPYDLDDMYSMLNEYKEHDAKQTIKRQDMTGHENNKGMGIYPNEKPVSGNYVPKQLADTDEQKIFSREKDRKVIDSAYRNTDGVKAFDSVMQVDNVDFKKRDNKKVSAVYETCALRDIPKCLVEMAKKNFPHAPNYIAVSAFLYAYRDKESEEIDYSGVPDNVRELAKAYERKNEAMRTSADIRRINDSLGKLNKISDEIILALSYLVYDANGFRRTEPAHPGDIDFYDPGIQKVAKQLEFISDKLNSERSYQQGKKKNMYGQKGQIL